jgi:hypothetical protein
MLKARDENENGKAMKTISGKIRVLERGWNGDIKRMGQGRKQQFDCEWKMSVI